MIQLSRTAMTGLVTAVLLTVAACGSGVAGPEIPTSTSVTATPSSTSLPTDPPTSDPVTAPPLTSDSEPVVTTESVTASEPVTSEVEVTPTPEPSTTTPEPEPAPAPESPAAVPPPAPTGDGGGRTVVIDPGHNGANGANPSIINAQVDAGFGETKACNTTGTETNDGYPEHAFSWAVATQVATLLEAQGVTVVMTRSSDDGVGPCVNERAAIGNDNAADAVVSIHGDGAAAGDRGFYAMTSERRPGTDEAYTRSLALATSVRDALVDQGVQPSNYLGDDGLWKRDDLAGLNLSQVPTTMIEMGNMRDADDAALMKSTAGQDAMASAIAQGILDFLAS